MLARRFVRHYRVLAIESSCDDTAACLINRIPGKPPVLEDHIKRTLDSARDGGIIPVDALAHHLQQFGPVINTLLEQNGRPKVDLVCATQGPGMFSSLAAGLQIGKGLAVAWNVPFVPVHHMLAHLLTPRFFEGKPDFPFLSLLVSGGHTMLVLSKSLRSHEILVDSIDNAIGNALDKCARHLGLSGNMLGRELDLFTAQGPTQELPKDFTIPLPLEKTHNRSSCVTAFSFAQFASLMPRFEKQYGWSPLANQPELLRRSLGIAFQDAMFTHVTRKIALALSKLREQPEFASTTFPLICSGGVASNTRLRGHLEKLGLELHFPDPKWCTDNALMIGWAGIELWEAGAPADLGAIPRAKWPLSDL